MGADFLLFSPFCDEPHHHYYFKKIEGDRQHSMRKDLVVIDRIDANVVDHYGKSSRTDDRHQDISRLVSIFKDQHQQVLTSADKLFINRPFDRDNKPNDFPDETRHLHGLKIYFLLLLLKCFGRIIALVIQSWSKQIFEFLQLLSV